MKKYLACGTRTLPYQLVAIVVASLLSAAYSAKAENVTPCPWGGKNCGIWVPDDIPGGTPGGGGGRGVLYRHQNEDMSGRGRGTSKKDPPSQNNSQIPCEGEAGVTGHPVIVMTGEKIKSEPDFDGEGLYGLGLTRIYRSQHPSGTLFGPNWLSSLDVPKLVFSDSTTINSYSGSFTYWENITLTRPDGTVYRYAGIPVDSDGRTPGVNYLVATTTDAANTGIIRRRSGNETYELRQDKKIYLYGRNGTLQSIYDNVTGKKSYSELFRLVAVPLPSVAVVAINLSLP